MEIRQDFIKVGTKRRSGKPLKRVVFLVAHDTGNPNSTAKNNVDYYKRSCNDMSASAHLFVDDKEIVQCIPDNEKAWHVLYNVVKDNELYNGDANDCALGIELSYFPNDVVRSKKAYANYVWLHANKCLQYGLDPNKHIVGHYTLDPQRKTDPINAFKVIGKTWPQFIADVKAELESMKAPKPQPTTPTPPKPSNPTPFKVGDYGKNAKVTADSLNVRAGRGTERKVIGSLKKGQVVQIMYILQDNRDGKGNDDLWGSIQLGKQVGYIHLDYVQPI